MWMRWSTFAALICILSACGTAPTVEQAAPSIVAEATIIPPTPTAAPTVTVAPTERPAPVWRDKLNGLWNVKGSKFSNQWLIDIDAGELSFFSASGNSDEPARISFAGEDGKDVYVRLHGDAGERLDTFHFVNDDLVEWRLGEREDEYLLMRAD